MHHHSLISALKDRRQMLNVTQETLAELSGVSLRTLKQFESGKGNPTLDTMHRLAAAVGMGLCLQVKRIASEKSNDNP